MTLHRPLLALMFSFLLALPVATSACGDSGGSSTGDGGTTDGSGDGTTDGTDGTTDGTGDGTDGTTDGTDGVTDDGSDDGCAGGSIVNEVNGKVLDEHGAAVEGAKAQSCIFAPGEGNAVCLQPVDTGADGTFSTTLPDSTTCAADITLRVLRLGPAGPAKSSVGYCVFDVSELEGGVLDLAANPVLLHETFEPDSLEQVDAELWRAEWDAGLMIDVNPAIWFNGALGIDPIAARWVEIDDPSAFCMPEALANVSGAWAISPEGDVNGGTFAATIQDKEGLADGTAVTLYTMGGIGTTFVNGDHIPEGKWEAFGTSTVQGGEISVSGDDGLPTLGWIAYAPTN